MLPRPTLQQKKIFLAHTAAKVFSHKGYANTSLQDISEEAGLSKGGIYHYFKEKESLFFCLIKLKHHEFIGLLHECGRQYQDGILGPREALANLIHTYADFINSEKYLNLLVMHGRNNFAPKTQVQLKRMEQEIYRTVKSQLDAMVSLNSDYSTGLIAFMIIAACHWSASWLRDDGRISQEDAIGQMIAIISHGVVFEESPEAVK